MMLEDAWSLLWLIGAVTLAVIPIRHFMKTHMRDQKYWWDEDWDDHD